MAASLATRFTSNYEESYSDRGTGSKKDVSVWRAKLLDGEKRISYLATNSRGSPGMQSPVVRETCGGALAKPLYFQCVWCDKGTGGKRDGSLWKPIAPAGFVALSDVAVHMSNKGVKPGIVCEASEIDPDFRCVAESLLADAECGSCVWSDRGSGGKYDGALWEILGFPGMRATEGKKYVPQNQQYKLKAFTGSLYRDMECVFSVTNGGERPQPDAKRTLTVGMTVQNTTSESQTEEIGHEVAMKASLGVKDVCCNEVAAKLSHKLTASTTTSHAEVSTQQTAMEVSFHVPGKTRAELYQMVITDSAEAAFKGCVRLKTAHYEIVNVPL